MIAQSLASLDRIYGPEGRESLEDGAGLKLYITPRDQRTVREVLAAVGKYDWRGGHPYVWVQQGGAWRDLNIK